MADWELQLPAPAQHHEKIILHITGPGRDQNSKLEI